MLVVNGMPLILCPVNGIPVVRLDGGRIERREGVRNKRAKGGLSTTDSCLNGRRTFQWNFMESKDMKGRIQRNGIHF